MTTWTTVTDTSASWYGSPPTGYQLLTEDGQRLLSEESIVLLTLSDGGWTTQSSSAVTWTTTS